MIGPYIVHRQCNNKYIIVKAVNIVDLSTGCSEIIQYDDKYVITIVNLVETMLITRYPWSM